MIVSCYLSMDCNKQKYINLILQIYFKLIEISEKKVTVFSVSDKQQASIEHDNVSCPRFIIRLRIVETRFTILLVHSFCKDSGFSATHQFCSILLRWSMFSSLDGSKRLIYAF